MSLKKIGFIGAGNVAWHLAVSMHKAGLDIVRIVSRSASPAKRLAKETGAAYSTSLRSLDAGAEVWIMAVPDDAITGVLEHLPSRLPALVHTSGSTAIAVLDGYAERTGVFYPLQTFSAQRPVSMQEVPLCIEAGDVTLREDLEKLARRISDNVRYIDSKQRRQLHLAAVFACNFTNALYGVAEQLLSGEGLPFELLHPLIAETARKATEMSPFEAQTGPALRNDRKTLESHLALLRNHPQQAEIYALMSRLIQEMNTKKKK